MDYSAPIWLPELMLIMYVAAGGTTPDGMKVN